MICPHCGSELGSAVKCPYCGRHAGFGGNTAFYRKAEASALSLKDVFCTLRFDGKIFWLTDENSSAGTFLDSGKRLSSGVPTALRSNASFYLGSRDEMFRISF